jgi:hypothetical protein
MVKHNDEEWTLPRRKPITKEVLDRAVRAEEDAATLEIAKAICRVKSPGSPTCVMDEHPDREPCNENNCINYSRALAAIETMNKHLDSMAGDKREDNN